MFFLKTIPSLLLYIFFKSSLYAMEALPDSYNQDSINNFDATKYFDPGLNLHYGFIYGFEKGVSHTDFEKCSVQEGLKKGQNVYVDDEHKTLVITEKCTHWIDISPDDQLYNKKQLDALIVTINSLNIDTKGKHGPRFNTIQIHVIPVENNVHRYSTLRFNLYCDARFFKRLENLQKIEYVSAINNNEKKMCCLFVDQEIIKNDGKNYYYPFVLVEPNQKHTILFNGIINKRDRENKKVFDTIFFTCADEDITKQYSIVVHSDIVIQEMVRGQLCDDGIHTFIGNPPVINRIKKYPLWLLRKLAQQYKIDITLLISPDQWDDLDFYETTKTCEKSNSYDLITALNRSYCMYKNANSLFITNDDIESKMYSISPVVPTDDLQQWQETLLSRLRFLCWIANINTIQINVSENTSSPDLLHSFMVISPESLDFFEKIFSTFKIIRFFAYPTITGCVNKRFIHIHQALLHIISAEKREPYNISATTSLEIDQQVFIAPYNKDLKNIKNPNSHSIKPALPKKQTQNWRARIWLSSIILKALCFSLALPIIMASYYYYHLYF